MALEVTLDENNLYVCFCLIFGVVKLAVRVLGCHEVVAAMLGDRPIQNVLPCILFFVVKFYLFHVLFKCTTFGEEKHRVPFFMKNI